MSSPPSTPVGSSTLNQLRQIIAAHTHGEEDKSTDLADLALFRREHQSQPCCCMVEPSVVLVVQGEKQMLVGDARYPYNARHFLLNSIDLPASSQVLTASPAQPCMGLVLRLDLRIMAELIAQGGICPPAGPASQPSMALGTVTPALLDAFSRLLALLDQPQHISVLAPLIKREIHYRLLMSDQASRLWQILATGSHSQRIARAIDWLKTHYTEPLRIDELAARVQMSSSSLHHHFRQLTTMSPLQYVKWLRLNEARRLMLSDKLEAGSCHRRLPRGL